MKKYSLVLAAGVLFFASCSSNNTTNANNQAAIDSMANAKAAAMQNNMAASNDSMINAVAKAKADSMEMAKKMETMSEKKEGHGAPAHHSTHEGSGKQTPPPPPANSKADKFNQMGGTNTNNSNQQAPNTNSKADKFNQMGGGK